MNAPPGYIPQLYGRSKGHALKPRQMALMRDFAPRLAAPDPAHGPIDLDALFPQAEGFELEVGFGGGEHLVWQAAARPKSIFFGAEPFLNGVAKLAQAIEREGISNVRIRHGDARPLIETLPAGRLSRIYVLHPDPWPKKRHFKRRMISPWFLKEAVRLLASGGELRVATDIADYARWTLMHAQNFPALEWTAERADDWRVRPADWPQTRYEKKALTEGRPPAYFIFRRR